jgi:hypothetical protein
VNVLVGVQKKISKTIVEERLREKEKRMLVLTPACPDA